GGGARTGVDAGTGAGVRAGVTGGSGSGGDTGLATDDVAAGLVAALAFPERVARARGSGAYVMASGTGAELGDGSRTRSAAWLAG
ncbi:hypothetical protein ADK38_03750, partial [Streptomyces varsoviensis]